MLWRSSCEDSRAQGQGVLKTLVQLVYALAKPGFIWPPCETKGFMNVLLMSRSSPEKWVTGTPSSAWCYLPPQLPAIFWRIGPKGCGSQACPSQHDCLDTESRYNYGPAPLNRAQKAIILHTLSGSWFCGGVHKQGAPPNRPQHIMILIMRTRKQGPFH